MNKYIISILSLLFVSSILAANKPFAVRTDRGKLLIPYKAAASPAADWMPLSMQTNCILRMELATNTGTNYTDDSWATQKITSVDSPTWGTRSLTFSKAQVLISTDKQFPSGAGTRTVVQWIKYLDYPATDFYIPFTYGALTLSHYVAYAFDIRAGKHNMLLDNGAGGSWNTTILSSNTWYMLAFTIPDSANATHYLNGNADGTFALSSGSWDTTTNGAVYLGALDAAKDYSINGYLGACYAFKAVLTTNELLCIYSNTATWYGL